MTSEPVRRRRLPLALRWLHRWAGITVGLVLVVVSLSGSALLFQAQFFRWAHGELIPARLASEAGSIDRWVANARAAVPGLGEPIAIWMPHVAHNVSDAGMLVFGGLDPGGLGNMGFAGVLVAPASGAVLGVIDIDRSPAYAPLFLHRDLWAGEAGRVFIGAAAVASLLMLGLGVYLWWPARGRVRAKLFPRRPRATLSRARPLHGWVGIWLLPLLVVLTASGLYLVRPGWVAPLLETLPEAHAEHEPGGVAAAGACPGAIGFDAAIARAREVVPSGTLAAIYPHGQAWELVFRPGDTAAPLRDSYVLADLGCGTVALEASPADRSPRDAAEAWLTSLHDGTALGTTGQVLVTVVGLAPLLLLWSGVLTWLRRRRILS